MPLDDTGKIFDIPVDTFLDDPLARMGITPVPAEFVTRYKHTYRAKWLHNNQLFIARLPGPFVWRTITYVDWKIYVNAYVKAFEKKNLHLVSHKLKQPLTLETFMNRMMVITKDRSAAPQALVDLANRVERSVPDAAFSLDYFYTDPVLNVTYSCADASKTACLGIWDEGVVVAIAEQTGVISDPVVPQVSDLVSQQASSRRFLTPWNLAGMVVFGMICGSMFI